MFYSLQQSKGNLSVQRQHLSWQCHVPLHWVAWCWCKGKNAYVGKLLCLAVPTRLWGMFYPAAPCLVCGCRDHYINNPEILAGSPCWWSLLSWLVCVFPAVDCIRDNWRFMDAFQILLIHVRHCSGCQKDVLGSWINRDMVCANWMGYFHKPGFSIKVLSTHHIMLGNIHVINWDI